MAEPLIIRSIVQGQPLEIRVALADDSAAVSQWQNDANTWVNVIRNRGRWAGVHATVKELYESCAEQLHVWNVDVNELRKMRGSEVVEVSLPAGHTPLALAARRIPWEFVIGAALVEEPGSRLAPVIVRYLQSGQSASAQTPAGPAGPANAQPTVLFVQSSPGELNDAYEFASERSLVKAAFQPFDVNEQTDPTAAALAALVADLRPAYIHISGVDIRQGARFVKKAPPPTLDSGLYLKSPDGQAVPMSATQLAAAVTAGGSPTLVALNAYYSADLAAAAVLAGAETAVGFAAEFDDAAAEVFFTEMYQAISAPTGGKRPVAAFRQAFATLATEGSLRGALEGAPIVLWTRQSILNDVASTPDGKRRVLQAPPALTVATVRDILEPYIEFPADLNYCGLHNGASLFDRPAKLGILNKSEFRIPGIRVDVSMAIGSDRFRFSRSFVAEVMNVPIENVNLSLTSEMARGLREKVLTNITVAISFEGQTLFTETKQVGLLATDEWQRHSPWLPSFVLPRDPAVLNIVRWARPFLCAIADASEVGFDNYARLSPGPATAADEQIVDRQVSALWWTIRERCRLNYIAAPPSYSLGAQRIRTPSAVLHGRAGTCLDLALLVAACLSAVDLHAALFVFSNHAFPAYFRRPSGHDRFRKLMTSKYAVPDAESASACAPRRRWILGKDGFAELKRLMSDGELVPLETVALTDNSGFASGQRRALTRLNDPQSDFEAIYDVTLARENNVTPLPIAGLV